MAGVHLDEKQIRIWMDRIIARTMRMDLPWNWQCGVAYYGIGRAYEATGKEAYLNVMKDRVDELIELGVPKPWTVNRCAMGHCLITLYEAGKDQKYLDLVLEAVAYLKNDAPRFGDGVLQHTVSADDDFPEQCWADTLFMAAYFCLRAGVLTDDEELICDALKQYSWHIRYLQDKESGLWYHGYNHQTRDHMSAVHWARANAWGAYTMAQAGKCLPKSYLYPEYQDIAGSLEELLSAVKFYQAESGMWRTVLDDPDSYEEVSASCGIAAAMILKGNPLHRKNVDRFLEGLANEISEDGRVLHVSAGTAVMRDVEGYKGISCAWIQGWGQGLTLAVLAAEAQILTRDR